MKRRKNTNTHDIVLFPEEQEGFKEHLRIKNFSGATVISYFAGVKQFLEWVARRGIGDLREVTKDIIREYQQYIMSFRCPDGQAYTRNTASIKLRGVKRFFQYLEETRQILYNPAKAIKHIELGERLPANILSKDEAELILKQPDTTTFKGIRDRMMMEILYSTGIRREEISQLTVYDVDCKSGFLRVNKGKFAKDRVLPLGKTCIFWIKEYLREVRPKLTKDRPEERSLLVGQTGKALSSQAVGVYVKFYARQAGIRKQVSPHTWRHTFASHMLAGGADILQVQRLLGHSAPDVTIKYTRVTPVDVKDAQKKTHPREKDREDVIRAGKDMPCQEPYRRTKQKTSNC